MQTQPGDHSRDLGSKKLLFVNSGTFKKRLAFESACRLGIETYLLNSSPGWADEYSRKTVYLKNCSLPESLDLAAKLHREVSLDGVVTFWEEDVPTCALIAERLGLPGNTPEAAMNARSKYGMRSALRDAGVPVPQFRLITDEASLRRACRELVLPAVLKPEWGADSEWVTRVTSTEQAVDLYRRIKRFARVQDSLYPYPKARFILEEYMFGREVSVEGVVQDGRVTLYAIIDKAKMEDGSFIEKGEITPSRWSRSVQLEIQDMVKRGVLALGLTNSGVHAEVKITSEGPRIVEIGARMGGDCIQPLVRRVYGIDLAEENIRVALGAPVHSPRPARGVGISDTLVPDRSGRVHLRPFNTPERHRNVIEIVLTKRHGDEVRVPPIGYDNLAWVSVWGKSYSAARHCLNSQINRLEKACIVETAESASNLHAELARGN